MLNPKDQAYQPSLEELDAYISIPLFRQFYETMQATYQPLVKIEYSKDVWQRGWNIKLRKAGKALCVIYPRQGYFTVLVVVGQKEKSAVEAVLPQLSQQMQAIYHSTKEGMGQRWLMLDLTEEDDFYQDVLTLIRIRRESR